MNQKIFQKAMQTISMRRIKAKTENEQHYQEINDKIPEIAEINYQLAQTSTRILMGEDIEILKRQNLQAQRYCAQLLVNHGYPADYLDIHYTCEKCQDTGYSEGGYCSCLEKLIASLGTMEMTQQTQLKLCNFNQFNLEYYKGKITDDGINCYASMSNILQRCRQYAANFHPHASSLLFFGDVGVGKTHLSLSIVTEVLKQGYEVIYDSIGNLISRIEHEHFSREKSEEDTLQLLLNTDFLVLDDLGTEFQTQFNLSVVYTIINTRINRNLPTIISTNLNWQQLNEQYQERIMSRLFAVYESIEFRGPDVRLIKKRNAGSQYL
ncbi:MAG: ATP-binding protein [Oscillospiraceae bacterium]|nr:ATP-binding protein [Oscillospiraceae bacterium]